MQQELSEKEEQLEHVTIAKDELDAHTRMKINDLTETASSLAEKLENAREEHKQHVKESKENERHLTRLARSSQVGVNCNSVCNKHNKQTNKVTAPHDQRVYVQRSLRQSVLDLSCRGTRRGHGWSSSFM